MQGGLARLAGIALYRSCGVVACIQPGTRHSASPEARPPPGKIVRALLQALGSTAALVVIYYPLTLDHASTGAAITMLVIGLVVLIALVVFPPARTWQPPGKREASHARPVPRQNPSNHPLAQPRPFRDE